MFHGEVDFNVGEHSGTFGTVDSFQFHQGGGVWTEAVFFDEERHENAIEQAYQVITVHTVENIVREGKLQFAVDAVRFIE